MPCGRCGHKSRTHVEASWPPCEVPRCECAGWQAASNKAADFRCASCTVGRGYEWLNGRVVCWPCWRDNERAGLAEIVVVKAPLVRKAA